MKGPAAACGAALFCLLSGCVLFQDIGGPLERIDKQLNVLSGVSQGSTELAGRQYLDGDWVFRLLYDADSYEAVQYWVELYKGVDDGELRRFVNSVSSLDLNAQPSADMLVKAMRGEGSAAVASIRSFFSRIEGCGRVRIRTESVAPFTLRVECVGDGYYVDRPRLGLAADAHAEEAPGLSDMADTLRFDFILLDTQLVLNDWRFLALGGAQELQVNQMGKILRIVAAPVSPAVSNCDMRGFVCYNGVALATIELTKR